MRLIDRPEATKSLRPDRTPQGGDLRLIHGHEVTIFICRGDQLAQLLGEGGRLYVL